ncbi:NUDIX hydrolase domain-like protein [Neohortaea acidophila]|uniref:NUDIX hydrolase domain-like protein n=1 Tax=Neohortaea acidophila TaxID=245834 RepID=A0A6A6Q731_9PEZI|nr:NUDIX hydrolase domain-like protein [Neohortaea acidophila]KAF2488115.1 NUDIX hydrolase domain-like protein [Neohortaea acidophila]
MDSFNLDKLKQYIPKELPSVQLPSWPLTPSRSAQNEDDADIPTLQDEELNDNGAALSFAEPKAIPPGPKSNLDLINECDNFPYYNVNRQLYLAHVNTYYALSVHSHPDTELGYVLPSVAQIFRGLPDWKVDDDERRLTLLTGESEEERTRVVAATTQAMKATGHFAVLKGWRNELYPVYGPNRELLFSIERSASALFGIVTYGVHLTAYTKRKQDGEGQDETEGMRIWVPRRAATKSTYGGMLDNTVAGGMATGETPFECLVREADEEASLPEAVVRKGVKAVGTVTYFHIRDHRAGGETKLLQPECQYVYDLELAEDVVPKPGDDEVEAFELKTLEEVKQALRDGEFKPNCALVLLDFFIRHGFLTEDDTGFIEIVARLHRRLDFPTR